MNLLYGELGGRPRKNDDFMLMQAEAYKAMVAPYKHLETAKGPFILYGCVPDGINKSISAGMVFLNGEFLEFDGATNVTFPANLGVLTELNTPLQYQDGNTKNTRQRRSASLDPAADFTKTLYVDPSVYQELNDLIGHTYGNQSFSGTKTFKDNLIVKTLNVYDELVSLGNRITSSFNTLTTNVNNAIQNITNQIANKADKQQLTWVDVQPASGWMCYPSEQLQVAKDQFGMVYVRGTINPTTYNPNPVFGNVGTIATLPAGYRPSRTQQYVLWESGSFFGAMNIYPDGTIEGYNGGSTSIPRFVIDYKIFSVN
jgi:hypothetical protein